jgi:hypothetical protein
MATARLINLTVLCTIITCALTSAASNDWSLPPQGIQPAFDRLLVTSTVQRTGQHPKTYEVQAWYFKTELVVRIRSDNSDIIGYEDKVKQKAAYWEKGFDTTTPYFPKNFLDGHLSELAAHTAIWYALEPMPQWSVCEAARIIRDESAAVTTITLRKRHRNSSTWVFTSFVYDHNRIIKTQHAVSSSAEPEREPAPHIEIDFADFDPQYEVARRATTRRLVSPYTLMYDLIEHRVQSVERIPEHVTALTLLADLTTGYRPVTVRMLNDPADRMPVRRPSSFWLWQVAAGVPALIFLIVLIRRISRRSVR